MKCPICNQPGMWLNTDFNVWICNNDKCDSEIGASVIGGYFTKEYREKYGN